MVSLPAAALTSTGRDPQLTLRPQVKVGDSIPSIELFRKNPGDKVNIADATKSGKSLIIAVPAAFSPGCSETHVPGYLGRSDKLDEYAGRVYVVSVNDAFV